MSQAACGGVMKGSGDGNDNAGGRDKRGREIPVDSPPSIDGDDSDDQDDDDSKAARRSTLDCLDSLEASLPMKRGLSTHYHGKSKSFANLHELGSEDAKNLGKKEHPINKRRRLLHAHDISDKKIRATYSSMSYTTSLPVLPSLDQYKKDEDEEDDTKGRSNQDQQDDGK